MKYVYKLKFLLCRTVYNTDQVEYNCPKCGDEGNLEILYDYSVIKKDFNYSTLKKNKNFSMWRCLPLLPVDQSNQPGPLKVGWTPLYEAIRIRDDLGIPNLWIKDDGRNPTASLKDRPLTIAIKKLKNPEKKMLKNL